VKNDKDNDFFCVTIGGDPGRVIRWDRADKHLLRRVKKLTRLYKNATTDMRARAISAVTYAWLEQKGKELITAFDTAFGDGASRAMLLDAPTMLIPNEAGECALYHALMYLKPSIDQFGAECEQYV